MKRITLLLLCLLVWLPLSLEPATAADQKDELTFSANYVRPENTGSTLTASLEYGAAFGKILVGPAISIVDGPGFDKTLVGAIGEWNLGSDEVCAFLGARALYDTDAEDGEDDIQVTARAGVKMFFGRGLARFEAARVTSGFGENTDLVITAGAGIRF